MINTTLTCSLSAELDEAVHEREIEENTQRRRLVQAALENYLHTDVALRNQICTRAEAEGKTEGELIASVMADYVATTGKKKTAKKAAETSKRDTKKSAKKK